MAADLFSFPPELLRAAKGPMVHVDLAPDGRPMGALAAARLAAPPSRVWSMVEDVEGYAGRVPMIHKARREGSRVHVELRYKVTFFKVGFAFTAEREIDPGRRMTLRWVAGEPRELELEYLVEELAPAESLLSVRSRFDIRSLGWLVKYFLRHHPEIELGIFPGTSLAILDAIRAAAEA